MIFHDNHLVVSVRALAEEHCQQNAWACKHISRNMSPFCALLCSAGASSAAQSTSYYGSFPPLLLDSLVEHVKDISTVHQDLAGMGRSLSNAYSLYLKTRPAGKTAWQRHRAASVQYMGVTVHNTFM